MKLCAKLAVLMALFVAGNAQRELDSSNFESAISESGDLFVKFYAPWCGHCKRLAPTWTELHEKMKDDPSVTIAKVDCTKHRDLCSQHGVRGYPTLKYFKQGSMEGEKYQGGRDVASFEKFILTLK